MYEVSDELKKLCLKIGESVFVNYKLTFSDIGLVIDNETLHQESVALKSSITDTDGEELEFGGCIASSFEFEVSEIVGTDLKNQKFKAEIQLIDEDEVEIEGAKIPIGEFIVDEVQLADTKDYKKVTAYDAMYSANKDVSDWYNSVFPIAEEETTTDAEGNQTVTIKYGTLTLKEFKTSLLDFLGIPYEEQSLENDAIPVAKTINPSDGSLYGQTLLKMIAVAQGGFGRANRDGKFEITTLTATSKETIYNDSEEYPEYHDLTYEEYMCNPITALKISTDDEDVGTVVGTDLSNPYVITGNYLFYGKTDAELQEIGNNILPKFQAVQYKPINMNIKGIPYLDAGDCILIENGDVEISTFVLTRELKGIHGILDNYVSQGGEYRKNEVKQSSIIEQLKNKTLKIQKSVDGISVELSDLDKKATSLISQLADEIVLKVDSNGNLVEVGLGVDADDGKTYFKVKSDNISMTAEEAIELIAGGDFNLTGKNITISSDNFNVSPSGEVEIKDGSIYITNGEVYVNINPSEEDIFKIGIASDLPPSSSVLDALTWSTIEKIANAGLAQTYFKLGDTKNVTIGTETFVFEIIAFDTDTLANGYKAPITFMIKDIYSKGVFSDYINYWWGDCALRDYLNNTVFPLLPEDLQSVIQTVKKDTFNISGVSAQTEDVLFAPSRNEMLGDWSTYDGGTPYTYFSENMTNRIKYYKNVATAYWTRTASQNWINYKHWWSYAIKADGSVNTNNDDDYEQYDTHGIVFGFCVGDTSNGESGEIWDINNIFSVSKDGKGIFNGTIYATDGIFQGDISGSTMTSGLLKSSDYVKDEAGICIDLNNGTIQANNGFDLSVGNLNDNCDNAMKMYTNKQLGNKILSTISLGRVLNEDGTTDSLIYMRSDGYVRFGLERVIGSSIRFNYSTTDNNYEVDADNRVVDYLVYSKNFKIDIDGNVFMNAKEFSQGDTTITSSQLTAINNNLTEMGATISEIDSRVTDLENGSSGCDCDERLTTLESDVDELFQSVSSGKASVASAITDKGVQTASDATFTEMSENIRKISTNSSPLLYGVVDWNTLDTVGMIGIYGKVEYE